MKLEDLDFDTVSQERLKALENAKEMVLSTCSGSHVTSRVVSTACRGTTIIFLSWGHHTKCAQISENPNVAVCCNNMQLEGTAAVKGSPLDAQNSELMELYKEKQPELYRVFPNFKGMQLIEVVIKTMTFYPPNTLFLDRIDFRSRTAFRESMQED